MSPRETPRRAAPAKTTGDGAGAASGSSETRPREPYRPPRLVVYGPLTEITRFGGSEVVDSGGGLGALP